MDCFKGKSAEKPCFVLPNIEGFRASTTMSQAPAIPRVLHGFGPRLQFHMPETWQKLGEPGRDLPGKLGLPGPTNPGS